MWAASASAYDRQPIKVYGLVADRWGQSTTMAQRKLMGRFSLVSSVWCTGAIIVGDEADSSWTSGLTRYWDKLACGGYASGQQFALIFDPKGRSADAWVIYRLKGVTRDALG
jgi:hypothetical protein